MSERTTKSARKRSAAHRDSLKDATPDIQPPGSIKTMSGQRPRRDDDSEDDEEEEKEEEDSGIR